MFKKSKNFKIILGAITLILITIFYIINIYQVKDLFTNPTPIEFLNTSEIYQIFKRDKDNYFKSFYKNDLYARHINSIQDYLDKIRSSTYNITDKQKTKITKCINNVNETCKNIKLGWFDGKKANSIKWKIGGITGKLYENGLPHTRDDIILISDENINNYSDTKLTKTLLHEKVHIYQKIYPDDIQLYISSKNFKKIRERSPSDNIRANPDLDNWIYQDLKGDIYEAIYNNNPSSIEDITYKPINNQSYEHPYEKMAIEIEKYV